MFLCFPEIPLVPFKEVLNDPSLPPQKPSSRGPKAPSGFGGVCSGGPWVKAFSAGHTDFFSDRSPNCKCVYCFVCLLGFGMPDFPWGHTQCMRKGSESIAGIGWSYRGSLGVLPDRCAPLGLFVRLDVGRVITSLPVVV